MNFIEKKKIFTRKLDFESYKCIAEREIKGVVDQKLLKCFGPNDFKKKIPFREMDSKIGAWKKIKVIWKRFKALLGC